MARGPWQYAAAQVEPRVPWEAVAVSQDREVAIAIRIDGHRAALLGFVRCPEPHQATRRGRKRTRVIPAASLEAASAMLASLHASGRETSALLPSGRLAPGVAPSRGTALAPSSALASAPASADLLKHPDRGRSHGNSRLTRAPRSRRRHASGPHPRHRIDEAADDEQFRDRSHDASLRRRLLPAHSADCSRTRADPAPLSWTV